MAGASSFAPQGWRHERPEEPAAGVRGLAQRELCMLPFLHVVHDMGRKMILYSMPGIVLSTSCSDSFNAQRQVYKRGVIAFVLHMGLVLVSRWDPDPWGLPSESGHTGCDQGICSGSHA